MKERWKGRGGRRGGVMCMKRGRERDGEKEREGETEEKKRESGRERQQDMEGGYCSSKKRHVYRTS